MVNRIYIDTEFTNFARPSLISIGAVSDTGAKFYAEITDYPIQHQSEFVREVIVPLLDHSKFGIRYTEAGARFAEWISEQGECQICCDYSEDWILTKALLDSEFPSNLANDYLHINQVISDIVRTSHNQHIPDYSITSKFIGKYFIYYDEYFVANSIPRHHALNDAIAMKHSIARIKSDLLY